MKSEEIEGLIKDPIEHCYSLERVLLGPLCGYPRLLAVSKGLLRVVLAPVITHPYEIDPQLNFGGSHGDVFISQIMSQIGAFYWAPGAESLVIKPHTPWVRTGFTATCPLDCIYVTSHSH